MIPIIDRLSSELATRYVLKKHFGFTFKIHFFSNNLRTKINLISRTGLHSARLKSAPNLEIRVALVGSRADEYLGGR